MVVTRQLPIDWRGFQLAVYVLVSSATSPLPRLPISSSAMKRSSLQGSLVQSSPPVPVTRSADHAPVCGVPSVVRDTMSGALLPLAWVMAERDQIPPS